MSSPERVRELLGRVLPQEGIARFAARDGVPDCPAAAPSTAEEAAEVVRLARAERWTVLCAGNGSKLGWARPPARCDLVLSSRNLRGIVAYEPADGTLTARSGTPWSELVEATRARHHLSPELPGAARATLGGVLGAGASGLDRLRHGPLRHQVLGMLALHADARAVKSGGRVVKNVTGYDLHRLWCGSQGTLCFLLEATLRLYPAPAEVAVLRMRCASLAEGLARSHALWRAGVQPVAAVLSARREVELDVMLHVVLSGRAEAVASEVEAVRPHLGEAETLLGEAARRARAELCERELESGRWPPLVLACRPSRLAGTLDRLGSLTSDLGLSTRLLVHPLLARVAVELPGTELDDERVSKLVDGLSAGEFTARWCGLGARTPPTRVPAAAAQLMQRLKQSLDPGGLFAGALP